MKISWMQLLRIVMMVLAIAGIIYALEYLKGGIAVWFWITVLGLGFLGLLYTFRVVQRRERYQRRAQDKQEKKKLHRRK